MWLSHKQNKQTKTEGHMASKKDSLAPKFNRHVGNERRSSNYISVSTRFIALYKYTVKFNLQDHPLDRQKVVLADQS